jgi:hypothetical protein
MVVRSLEEEEEEPYLMFVRSRAHVVADLFCTPVPYRYLPLLFQGVSASDLPTNRYL